MVGAQNTLQGGCGVHNWFGFEQSYYSTFNPQLGGAKLAVACFINTPRCRDAYKELAEKFQIVYQSSVRRNTNSGNRFFMVVYDGAKK